MPRSFPLVTLVILDGFGCAPPGPGNAVELADTPVFDGLVERFPHTTIEASGEAAGLPPGQMGNSEVGHLTIGSGRRLYQDLMRVNRAIADHSLASSPVLRAALERGRRVHLLGLVSHGGVHSHIDHLHALLELVPDDTWIHAFTDGRDVSPHTAHTTNRVPLVVTTEGELRDDGEIADIAPTVLSLLGLKEPLQMSGKDLLKPS